jgi:hypothetical protein
MNSKSRFTKIAVSAGLVVMSGAAVLGLTGYASAHLAPSDTPVVTEQVVVPAADGQLAGQDAPSGQVAAADGNVSANDGHVPISPVNLAKALGLSETELQSQVQSGKSLADIAKAQNVDIQKVKDALVADLTAHLDGEVKAGVHTQAEADAKLAEFKTRLDDIVNGVRPAGAPGTGGHGGRHGHGPMGGDFGRGPAGTQDTGFSA